MYLRTGTTALDSSGPLYTLPNVTAVADKHAVQHSCKTDSPEAGGIDPTVRQYGSNAILQNQWTCFQISPHQMLTGLHIEPKIMKQ